MKKLLLPVLLVIAACGAPANVQAPVGGGGDPTRAGAPAPTPIVFHVVAKSARGMQLIATEGALFVHAGKRLTRIGANDLAESAPPPLGKDQWIVQAMSGRWPNETRIAGYVTQGCRASSIQFFKWDGAAWVADGGGSVGYVSAALPWQMRRPTPKVPGCASAYSPRADDESGFMLASAGCGGKSAWYFFTPGQAEGSPVEWLADSRNTDGVRLAGGSATDAYAIVDGNADRKPMLMHFDGRGWSESSLPIRGTDVQIGAAAATPGGTLWLIAHDEATDPSGSMLFRRERGGEWRSVDVGGGLVAERVNARDENDVWVVATTPGGGATPRPTTLLHTGAAPAKVVDLDDVTR